MSVVDAVVRKLADWPADVAESVEAAQALRLAEDIDDPGTRPTARALASRELRETMTKLRELIPPDTETDWLDELNARRAARRGAAASGVLGS